MGCYHVVVMNLLQAKTLNCCFIFFVMLNLYIKFMGKMLAQWLYLDGVVMPLNDQEGVAGGSRIWDFPGFAGILGTLQYSQIARVTVGYMHN